MPSEADILKGLYHYVPSKAPAIIFAVLYGASMGLHEAQYRKTQPQKFTMPLALGATFSTIGFAARAFNALGIGDLETAWRVSSMFTLGAAPTYAAADYLVCGRLFCYVRAAAPVSPLRTVRTFIAFDLLAEVAVWLGSGLRENGLDTSAKAAIGLNLVRVAMIAQLSLFVCFLFLVGTFHARAVSRGFSKGDGPAGWIKVVYALYASSVLIMIRCAYHIAESFVPIDHPLRTHEAPFFCLEAVIMLLNTGLFNLYHPANLLPCDSRVYLLPNGDQSIDESAKDTLTDTRPLRQIVLDPLDIKGLFVRPERAKGREEVETGRRGYEMAPGAT